MDNKKIINMNGRVYDPLTSQFLSPDPYVADATNVLGYHTIDSRAWGPLYLFAIGLPSAISAKNSTLIERRDAEGNDLNPNRLRTHSIYWTEIRANKRAEKYFRKRYGINWNFPRYPLSNPF